MIPLSRRSGQNRDSRRSSLVIGIIADFLAAAMIIAASVQFSVWGAARGLTVDQDGANTGARATRRGAQFGKGTLYRKKLLWSARDRSALVRALLIPLSLAESFFAVYHPMLSWPPVFLVGMVDAMLFNKTDRRPP